MLGMCGLIFISTLATNTISWDVTIHEVNICTISYLEPKDASDTECRIYVSVGKEARIASKESCAVIKSKINKALTNTAPTETAPKETLK